MNKQYIIEQHNLMEDLENKAHSKKLEFERIFYKNSKDITTEEHNKNYKRMIKLDKEMKHLIEKINEIRSDLDLKISEYRKDK